MTPIRHRETDALQRLTTFMYLIPIFGVVPSLVTLYRRQADRRELSICRLSVLMALIWFFAYVTLNVGTDISGLPTMTSIRLLFVNGSICSGYFLVSLWLMVRLWQGKSVRVPGLSGITQHWSDS
jgi:hypothetical protein